MTTLFEKYKNDRTGFMNIAIVDDEQQVRNTLKDYIAQFAADAGMKMDVTEFASGDDFLENYSPMLDIVIFDIDMPGTNGMDTARLIREKDQRITIIFITNVAQYAINGYEVDAVDYIIKPIGYYEFSMKFHRTVAKAAQKKEHMLMIETVDGYFKVRVSKINYVEVMSHYLYIHTADRTFKMRGSIGEQEEALKPYNFVRVHKSYLVNMANIRETSGKEILVGGEQVPIARGYKDKFMTEYMQYLRGI